MTDHGASASLEIERKYEVLGDEPLPRIELPGAASVAEIRAQMVASYWDTPARDLGRAGLAMRSRSGGSDAGWHLKERGPDGVRELHWPLADEIPDGALNALRERLGASAESIRPVATVQTDRTVRRLLDAEGRLLVELADDHVLATDHDAGAVRAWREWEAELGEGADLALFDVIEPQLIAAGARPSLSEAKIQRTLGQTVPAAWRRGAELPELVACALTDLADRIAASEDAVRADEPEAVHRTRILVRRARDLITVFRRDLGLASDETKPATRALAGLGALLGEVRDAEVRADLAERLLSAQPAAAGMRKVRRLLVGASQTARAAAFAGLRERIESDGDLREGAAESGELLAPRAVASLLREVAYRAARQDPAARAEGSAEEAIAARIDARLAKTLRAYEKRANSFADIDGAARLHRIRKQARRIRYAVEELGERSGAPVPLPASLTARLARGARGVQSELGEVRDALALAQHLDEIAGLAPVDDPARVSEAPRDAASALAAQFAEQVRAESVAKLASASSAIARLGEHRLGA